MKTKFFAVLLVSLLMIESWAQDELGSNLPIIAGSAAGSVGSSASSSVIPRVAGVPLPQNGNDSAVGSLPGSLEISSAGEAQYTIPLQLPSGVGGWTPQMALSYGSNRGNGMLGKGWALSSGAGGVSRCGSTTLHDDQSHPVNYTARDRFCLEGQRLFLVSGSSYGAPGSIYALEIDSFSRIHAIGGTHGHPDHFIREDKNGERRFYGQIANAKHTNTAGQTYSWALSSAEDVSGNLITFHYHNAANQFYLDRVAYAYVSGAPQAQVQLLYQGRLDAEVSFKDGIELRRNKRLYRIQVNAAGQSSPIREYKLTYAPDTSDFLPTSRIISIELCAQQKCLPASQFEWNQAALSNFSIQGIDYLGGLRQGGADQDQWQLVDINGDGYDDLIYATQGENIPQYLYLQLSSSDGFGAPQLLHQAPEGNARPWVWDFNGDGRPDVRWAGTTFINTYQNGVWSLRPTSQKTPLIDTKAVYFDVNGDGIVDKVSVDSSSRTVVPGYVPVGVKSVYYVTALRVSLGLPKAVGNIREFSTPYIVNLPTLTTGPTSWAGFDEKTLLMGDFTGDGQTQLLMHKHRNQGQNFVDDPQGYVALRLPSSAGTATVARRFAGPRSKYAYVIPVDFNNDGLTDVLEVECNDFCEDAALSYRLMGNEADTRHRIADVDGGRITVFDIDGDGHPDLYTNSVAYLWRNGTFQPHPGVGGAILEVNSPSQSSSAKRGNIYGDSRSGWVHILTLYQEHAGRRSIQSSLITLFRESSGEQEQRIKAFTNGFGAREEVDYEDIASSSHYLRAGAEAETSFPIWDTLCIRTLGGGCDQVYDGRTDTQSAIFSRLNTAGALPPNANHLPIKRPVQDVNDGITVVSAVRRFKAVAAGAPMYTTQQGVQELRPVISNYYYARARRQVGRGFLGFESQAVHDVDSGLVTQTVYRQDYPFVGMPYVTQMRRQTTWPLPRNPRRAFSTEFTQWQIANGSGGRPFIYPELLQTSVQETNEEFLIKFVTTQRTMDDWGNADIATITEGEQGEKRIINATNTYASNEHRRRGLMKTTQIDTMIVDTFGDTDNHTQHQHFTYTPAGLLETQTVAPDQSALTNTTSYAYDNQGNLRQTTLSAQGLPSRIQYTDYDTAGRYMIRERDGKGQIRQSVLERNPMGQVIASQSANGLISQFRYDVFGNLTSRSENNGAWVTHERSYCAFDCRMHGVYQVTTRNADGQTSSVEYDAWGRNIRSKKLGPSGQPILIDSDYNGFDEAVRISEPYFNTDSSVWTIKNIDVRGQLYVMRMPGDRVVWTEEGFGWTTYVNARESEFYFLKNAFGQIYNHLNYRYTNHYDAQGNLRFNVRSPRGGDEVTLELRYDALGRKIYMDDPDKGINHYEYNAFGDLKKQTDASGNTQNFEYDILGRQIRRTDINAQGQVLSHTRWFYDGETPQGNTVVARAIGQLSGVVQSQDINHEQCTSSTTDICIIHEYDQLGRPSKTTTVLGSGAQRFTYSTGNHYDGIGRIYEQYDSMHDHIGPSGTRYGYNEYGYKYLLQDMVDNKIVFIASDWNARGSISKVLHGNGVLAGYDYDSSTGLIRAQTFSTGLNVEQRTDYEWDKNSNLTYRRIRNQFHHASGGLVSRDAEETFCYDRIDRLVKIRDGKVHCGGVDDILYDDLGNITYKPDVGHYVYGQGAGPHAVTNAGGVSYHYDARGNMIHDQQRTLTYGIHDKPEQIQHSASGATIHFNYGPDRDRWRRIDTHNGVTTTTLYLGNVERRVSSNSNTIEWKRFVGDSALMTVTTDSSNQIISRERHYLLKDIFGSVDLITNQIGGVVQHMAYDAWGQRRSPRDFTALPPLELLSFDVSITNRGYTEHEMLDSVGLIHMNGRVYDPRLGRFMSADIIVQSPNNGESYNRYSYMMNRPLSGTDPSGYEANLLDEIVVIGRQATDYQIIDFTDAFQNDPDFFSDRDSKMHELNESLRDVYDQMPYVYAANGYVYVGTVGSFKALVQKVANSSPSERRQLLRSIQSSRTGLLVVQNTAAGPQIVPAEKVTSAQDVGVQKMEQQEGRWIRAGEVIGEGSKDTFRLGHKIKIEGADDRASLHVNNSAYELTFTEIGPDGKPLPGAYPIYQGVLSSGAFNALSTDRVIELYGPPGIKFDWILRITPTPKSCDNCGSPMINIYDWRTE